MLQKLLNNFYWRNLAVLLIFISPNILQSIAIHEGVDAGELFSILFSNSSSFIFFIYHNRILYEKLLRHKKYIAYALIFLVTLFVWRESSRYVQWYLFKLPGTEEYHIRELQNYNRAFWLFMYWADIVTIYISLGIYLSFNYFKERARSLQLDNLKKDLELKQLNSQLNPHFLFNALNNIYRYQLMDSGKGELVLKLAELMRYVLDSSKRPLMTLEEEMKFIEHYIAFEKERLGVRCRITYQNEVEDPTLKIIPLLLFSFIENAFKHGTNSIQTTDISIVVFTKDKSLSLIVSNPSLSTEKASTKTGLTNSLRRLELVYPDTHQLLIHQDNRRYDLSLTLHLGAS